MRLTFVRIENGKRRMIWPMFLLYVATCFTTVIGASELFWKMFSGGYSPLIGLFAFYLATMIVLLALGEAFALPVHADETWLNQHDA